MTRDQRSQAMAAYWNSAKDLTADIKGNLYNGECTRKETVKMAEALIRMLKAIDSISKLPDLGR